MPGGWPPRWRHVARPRGNPEGTEARRRASSAWPDRDEEVVPRYCCTGIAGAEALSTSADHLTGRTVVRLMGMRRRTIRELARAVGMTRRRVREGHAGGVRGARVRPGRGHHARSVDRLGVWRARIQGAAARRIRAARADHELALKRRAGFATWIVANVVLTALSVRMQLWWSVGMCVTNIVVCAWSLGSRSDQRRGRTRLLFMNKPFAFWARAAGLGLRRQPLFGMRRGVAPRSREAFLDWTGDLGRQMLLRAERVGAGEWAGVEG